MKRSRGNDGQLRKAVDLDDALAQIRADELSEPRGSAGAACEGDAEHAAGLTDTAAAQAGPARNGSQKPDGGVHGSPARAGRDTPQPGPQQVLKAEPATADATDRGTPASASPDGGPMGVGQPAAAGPTGDQRRGPATGAQADGCRAPECHAGACSGRAQQDQTSLPASPMRIALWNDGALQVQTPRGDDLVVFSRDEVRQLVEYLSDPAMGVREQGASA